MEIGWIDFSTKDRQRAKQLLDFIKPEGQLDELGVGYLRDALSNQLFPGISTIQTRAKYFFLICHILRDYTLLSPTEKRKKTPEQYLKDREHEVKNRLRQRYNAQEGKGIIGVTLKERQYVKRNASEIYWNGLQTYGFLANEGLSLKQFLKNLHQPQTFDQLTAEEGDDASHPDAIRWFKTPYDSQWFDQLQISLTETEQSYFKERIAHNQAKYSNSILGALIENEALREVFFSSLNFEYFVQASLDIDMDASVKKTLILAHDFALIMEGVHYLYNDILQSYLFGARYEGIFLEAYQNWRKSLEEEMIDYNGFDILEVFKFTKYSRIGAEVFVRQWWEYIQSTASDELPTDAIRNLVKQRERIAKGTKSRLHKPPTANVDVTLDQYIGLRRFQYRFINTKTIIQDIYEQPTPEFPIDDIT